MLADLAFHKTAEPLEETGEDGMPHR
jgi:hypothetical protein